ncbi:MAG: HlyD family efflux transporter periplasmic adaptor subunit [Planctomycetes bacterium]|nr:HlyD family efflux transporter periplasmic adaptor subunit [Planctomycetota bacterium]
MRRNDAAIGEFEQRPSPLALHPERPEPGKPPAEVAAPTHGGAAGKTLKEAKMNGRSGPSRLVWALGILLLIITAVIAIWAVNSSGDNGGSPVDKERKDAPPAVVALGFVFSDPDVVNLSPTRPGRVDYVAPEGPALIKKGDVLLRLDDRIAKLEVEAAQAALADAREELNRAKNLPEKHLIDLELQKDAIEVAQSKLKIQDNELKIKQRQFDKKLINREELEISKVQAHVQKTLIEAEEAKFRALKLIKPELQVARANHDVEAKKVLLRKAELARDECELRAPSDGTVLRVNISAGEVLTAQAKLPAMQFCPDARRIVRAEVPQEWSDLVEKGQKVTIEDDTRARREWTGTIREVSDWFSPRRHPIIEPMVFNDVRTLECVIDVAPGGPALRIGQRVRVNIPRKQGAASK